MNAVPCALVESGFVLVPDPSRAASFEVDVQVPAVEPAHRATVLLPLPGVECILRLDASREGWTVSFPGTLVEVSAEPLDPCAVWSVADPEWADYASVVTCALWRISLEDHVCVERWSLLVEGDFCAFDARLLHYVELHGDGPRGDFESLSISTISPGASPRGYARRFRRSSSLAVYSLSRRSAGGCHGSLQILRV